MALLDQFLSAPTTQIGLSVLADANNPARGILRGITTNLANQRQQMLLQLQRQALAEQVLKSQQAQKARQLFSQGLGTRPAQFQPDMFPGESPSNLSGQFTGGLLSGGRGALADNRVDTDELKSLALDQLSIGNMAGVNSIMGYINATTPQTKSELALAAADGDTKAREALQILNGTETIKPLSHIGKIKADLANGLITQDQANRMIQAVGRSPGFKEQFMAPILLKIQQGQELTEGETQIKNFFKTTDPFDAIIRAAMQGSTANSEEQLLQDARDALQQGADRAAVEQRLRDRGIDPGKLTMQGTITR